MALQGTLDSFPLTDVLRLLAGSSKSGRLVVNGDRGHGQVWMASGAVTGGETSLVAPGGDPTEAVFDLLRFATGSFIFEPDAVNPAPTASLPVDYVISQSEAALAEWRELQAVVPSADAWLVLAEELPTPEVVVDQESWSHVIAVAAGIDVTSFGRLTGAGEVANLRTIRDLILAGLVCVGVRPAPQAPPAAVPVTATDDAPWDRWNAEVFEPSGAEPTDGDDLFGAFEPFARADEELSDGDRVRFAAPTGGEAPFRDDAAVGTAFVAAPSTVSGDEPANVASQPASAEASPGSTANSTNAVVDPEEDADADDVLRQMAMLSPKAAQAVATAMSGEGAVGTGAMPDTEAERDRLLKFLGSV